MADTTKLNLDIDKIRERLEIGKNHTISFPEIVCHKILETNISKWIAYFLDPKQNRYAVKFLNVLLRKVNMPECRSEDFETYNEFFLDAGSKIDIYIITQEYIIGIEVKMGATETNNDQTERYHKEILERCRRDNKQPIEIYLKPSSNANKHKCPNFKDVDFRGILPELRILSDSLPKSREHFMLSEFISFLENGPERARLASLLSDEEKYRLVEYDKKLYKLMTDFFAGHGFQKIKKKEYSDVGSGYMQIKRKGTDWEKIHFHYEILWSESNYLALNKKVTVAVHLLENSSQFSNNKKNEIINFFNTDLPDGRTLFCQNVDVDLTSIEKAENILDRIVEILDSKVVDQLGKTADDCIKKIFNKEE